MSTKLNKVKCHTIHISLNQSEFLYLQSYSEWLYNTQNIKSLQNKALTVTQMCEQIIKNFVRERTRGNE